MKCFTNSFKCSGLGDSAELKAVLFAMLACFLFIGFLTVVQRRSSRNEKRITRIRSYTPAPPLRPVRVEEPPLPPDLNARFRVAPTNFRGINFATRSYGSYRLPNGTSRDLVLIDGQFREFGDSQHSFDLNDVFYTDLTGDGSPEAIVMLTHFECGRECDGGKNLIYVYSQDYPRDFPMNEILKYESGSGRDGCSLKSLTVKNKQLTLDLFGDCPSNDLVIRDTYKLTRVEFFFNGKKLVEKKQTSLTVPNRNQVSYGVDVSISDDRTSSTQKF